MDYVPYRSDKYVKAAAASAEKILGREVPEGYVLEVTHMSIFNLTTAGDIFELGYVDRTENDHRLGGNGGTNCYRAKLNGRAWIEGGETPYGRVTTPAINDELVFSCHGKLWKK